MLKIEKTNREILLAKISGMLVLLLTSLGFWIVGHAIRAFGVEEFVVFWLPFYFLSALVGIIAYIGAYQTAFLIGKQ